MRTSDELCDVLDKYSGVIVETAKDINSGVNTIKHRLLEMKMNHLFFVCAGALHEWSLVGTDDKYRFYYARVEGLAKEYYPTIFERNTEMPRLDRPQLERYAA